LTEKRGTQELQQNMQRRERKVRSWCSKLCGKNPVKDRFYSFFISHFDASILILPFIFKRAGWLTSSLLVVFFGCWSYYSSLLTYECVRLLLGNYKMRQYGIDFEALIANFKHITTHGSFTAGGRFKPWLSRTIASPTSVLMMRQLYIIYLVLASSMGLVLCLYTVDDLYALMNNGNVYAL
jgi:hypothetical protein